MKASRTALLVHHEKYDWDSMGKWIEELCDVDHVDGHWIWESETCDIDSALAMTQFVIGDGTNTIKHQRTIRCWYAMASQKRFIPTINEDGFVLNFRSACNKKHCISHSWKTQIGLTSVLQFDYDDHMAQLSRIRNNCKEPDENGCRFWKKGRNHIDGQAHASFLGRRKSLQKVVWEINYLQEVPKGMLVRHLCGNGHKGCGTLEHLALGTPKDNAKDEEKLGRRKRGERNGAKLTESQARQVIDALGKEKTQEQLALEFGVTKWVIADIQRGRSWTHIRTPEEKTELKANRAPARLDHFLATELKWSVDVLTRDERAKLFGVSKSLVNQIDRGVAYRSIGANEKEDQLKMKEALRARYEQKLKNIKRRCTEYTDEKNETHWLWDNCHDIKDKKRRPMTGFFGKTIVAARASWLSYHQRQDMPPGKPWVLHTTNCPYKFCMRPKHLYAGDEDENAQDRFATNTINSKVDENQVEEIFALRNTDWQAVAEKFQISKTTVHNIWAGTVWQHVTGPLLKNLSLLNKTESEVSDDEEDDGNDSKTEIANKGHKSKPKSKAQETSATSVITIAAAISLPRNKPLRVRETQEVDEEENDSEDERLYRAFTETNQIGKCGRKRSHPDQHLRISDKLNETSKKKRLS